MVPTEICDSLDHRWVVPPYIRASQWQTAHRWCIG